MIDHTQTLRDRWPESESVPPEAVDAAIDGETCDPLAVLAAFFGLYFSDQSINVMTLGGLALAVGILIDQAIVVIDNIERHMHMGTKGRLQAAFDGTREVSVPLFVSTVTFIVVFFPVI